MKLIDKFKHHVLGYKKIYTHQCVECKRTEEFIINADSENITCLSHVNGKTCVGELKFNNITIRKHWNKN